MHRRLLPLVIAILGVLAACSESSLTLDAGARGVGEPGATRPDGEVSDPDEVVELALRDVQDFWERELPDVYGVEFEPLAGGLVPYGPSSLLPQCGDERIVYEDIAENALYCPADDLIAWDRVGLIPALQQQFGSLTIGLVMAHEFAHAIQVRGDVLGATVTLELQADCFAGAWVADVDDRVATFATDGESLDLALAGLLELRDTVGVSGQVPDAHGSGFDRISAFQTGFESGSEACASYEDDPPPVVAIPFRSFNDQVQGGNLPIDQLIEPLIADLESFSRSFVAEEGGRWDQIDEVVPVTPGIDAVSCGEETIEDQALELASFYCVSDDTIYLDGAGLVPALAEIGDFAFGGELARLYSFAAQAKLDVDGDDRQLGLHADCVTGVFASAEYAGSVPDQQLALSPGDLDEIIIAFLAFGDEDAGVTAFERTTAFRSGFFDGPPACRALL